MDESGDHGLANINPHFPVFVLCGVLFSQPSYDSFDKELNIIKNKFWGGKDVILHSRDIRKHEKEFSIFFNSDVKNSFFNELNHLFEKSDYVIITDGINKDEYIKRYGRLSSVYELCLSFIIERAIFYLDDIKEDNYLYIVIEERGKKENNKLKEHFNKILSKGTGYVVPERLKKVKLAFRAKRKNINGLQIADLMAYPIARYIMDKSRANPAFDLLSQKIYQKQGKMFGLKTYP